MSGTPCRNPPPGRGITVVPLLAVIASALASTALAGVPPHEPTAHEWDIPSRIAALRERILVGDPTLAQSLPLESKIAQWRNR